MLGFIPCFIETYVIIVTSESKTANDANIPFFDSLDFETDSAPLFHLPTSFKTSSIKITGKATANTNNHSFKLNGTIPKTLARNGTMEHLIIIHTQPRAINHLSVPRRGGQPNSAIIVHNVPQEYGHSHGD
ncbi:hypothetical protein LXL04_018055 [Taraxacum kok-saghyz]